MVVTAQLYPGECRAFFHAMPSLVLAHPGLNVCMNMDVCLLAIAVVVVVVVVAQAFR